MACRALSNPTAKLLEEPRPEDEGTSDTVLMYIGGKIFLHDLIKVPALLSLGVTLGLLAGGVILSLLNTRDQKAPQH